MINVYLLKYRIKNKMKIQTIDLISKEWFDKINGNCYFSCEITLNFGLKDEIIFEMPFQYGHGNHYEDMSFKAIKEKFNIKTDKCLSIFCRENNILLRSTKHENCLKRELYNPKKF